MAGLALPLGLAKDTDNVTYNFCPSPLPEPLDRIHIPHQAPLRAASQACTDQPHPRSDPPPHLPLLKGSSQPS